MVESLKSLPLPADPVLASCAEALNDAGYWAYVWDATFRLVFVTDEARLTLGDTGAATTVPLGCHYLGAEFYGFLLAQAGFSQSASEWRQAHFYLMAPYVLAGTPGGHDELRRVVAPELVELVDDDLRPQDLPPMLGFDFAVRFAGADVENLGTVMRIDDGNGRWAGVCLLTKPAAGMSQLAAAAATADLGHLERMRRVERPDRRPTAILMADLEASSPLSRRLSTAQYFAFGRRLVRAADQCVIGAGGIVGRHAGDGVVAFFLAETAGSESAAARSCLAAATDLRATLADIVVRSDIPESDVSLRFGLHWGSTTYIGRILTLGRSEVTALGDEVNEAARIEACASAGRTLASKALIERLNSDDAAAAGIDTAHVTYTQLADLDSATDKARRDAPAIAVCEINDATG